MDNGKYLLIKER